MPDEEDDDDPGEIPAFSEAELVEILGADYLAELDRELDAAVTKAADAIEEKGPDDQP